MMGGSGLRGLGFGGTASLATVTGTDPLLALLIELGAVLWVDVNTSAGMTLSGASITGLLNRMTSTALTIHGAPQYSATTFNGGPGATFNGVDDWVSGDESAVYNLLADDNPHTIIAAVDYASADATRTLFSVGRTDANDNTRYIGQWNNAAGRHREVAIGSAGTISVFGTSGEPTTSPALLEWSGSTTTTLRVNRTTTSINGAALDPGILTPNHWSLAAWSRFEPVEFGSFVLSTLLGFPSVLSTGDLDDLYAALAAHQASLDLT